MSKYGSRKVRVDGLSFDSQAEANRYAELLLLAQAGEIADLRVHPSWVLQPGFQGPDGQRLCADANANLHIRTTVRIVRLL